FKCVYVEYQPRQDWRSARDILRCNPLFQKEPRYDCVTVNMTDPGLHFARLRALFQCSLPNGRKLDIALVRMFTPSRCKPQTRWAGCQIRDESEEFTFLSMEHVVRARCTYGPILSKSTKSLPCGPWMLLYFYAQTSSRNVPFSRPNLIYIDIA
ncbi:hypothetical protein R3P38DRAFT_2563829, partial [Favolaschia claudopus]